MKQQQIYQYAYACAGMSVSLGICHTDRREGQPSLTGKLSFRLTSWLGSAPEFLPSRSHQSVSTIKHC